MKQSIKSNSIDRQRDKDRDIEVVAGVEERQIDRDSRRDWGKTDRQSFNNHHLSIGLQNEDPFCHSQNRQTDIQVGR